MSTEKAEEPSTSEEIIPSTTTNAVIRFDPGYVKTVNGIIKLAQIILSLIGFLCVQTIRTSVYHSAGGWYAFVSFLGFLFSLVFFLCYLFNVVERFNRIPWLYLEVGFAVGLCLLFFIASSVAATRVRVDPPWGAATFFGFAAMSAYGYETVVKYRELEKRGAAEGIIPAETSALSSSATPLEP